MKKWFSAVVLVSVVFVPLVALAVNPAITSFTVSPASGPSGYFFAFLWSLENAFGSSFLIPCIQGIKLRYSNGSALACGTRIASQVSANDGLGIKIINIGGNQASVTARVFPKDSYGKDYDAGGLYFRKPQHAADRKIYNFHNNYSFREPSYYFLELNRFGRR